MRCATSASETVRPRRLASATAARSSISVPQNLLVDAQLFQHLLVDAAPVRLRIGLHLALVRLVGTRWP